jgi:hypothetical protein
MQDDAMNFIVGGILGLIFGAIMGGSCAAAKMDEHSTRITLESVMPCPTDGGAQEVIVAGHERWSCGFGYWRGP